MSTQQQLDSPIYVVSPEMLKTIVGIQEILCRIDGVVFGGKGEEVDKNLGRIRRKELVRIVRECYETEDDAGMFIDNKTPFSEADKN